MVDKKNNEALLLRRLTVLLECLHEIINAGLANDSSESPQKFSEEACAASTALCATCHIETKPCNGYTGKYDHCIDSQCIGKQDYKKNKSILDTSSGVVQKVMVPNGYVLSCQDWRNDICISNNGQRFAVAKPSSVILHEKNKYCRPVFVNEEIRHMTGQAPFDHKQYQDK